MLLLDFDLQIDFIIKLLCGNGFDSFVVFILLWDGAWMVLGFNGKCEAWLLGFGGLNFWYYVLFISLAIWDIRFSNRLESKN